MARAVPVTCSWGAALRGRDVPLRVFRPAAARAAVRVAEAGRVVGWGTGAARDSAPAPTFAVGPGLAGKASPPPTPVCLLGGGAAKLPWGGWLGRCSWAGGLAVWVPSWPIIPPPLSAACSPCERAGAALWTLAWPSAPLRLCFCAALEPFCAAEGAAEGWLAGPLAGAAADFALFVCARLAGTLCKLPAGCCTGLPLLSIGALHTCDRR